MAEPDPQAKDSALSAMLKAQGRPDKSPMPGPSSNGKQAAAAALSLIDRINEMANRDQEDWRYLIDTLRKFVAQRRADLDYLERLLGTNK